MKAKEYSGFWMPAGLMADPHLSLSEKVIIARVASFPKGAWITSKTLSGQLGGHPTWIRRVTRKLVDDGWLTSRPVFNGLRSLAPSQKAKEAILAKGVQLTVAGVQPTVAGVYPTVAHRSHIDNKENTKNTCSSEHEQPTSSKTTNPDQPIRDTQPGGLVCSKPVWGIGGNPGGIAETPDVVPPRPAASGWDEYPDEDVEAAREECYADRTIAFPERAALGLLEHKAKCRKQIFTG